MGEALTRPRHPGTAGTRYEDDLYTWVHEQVALLNAGRLHELDRDNIAEELLDVGKSEYAKLESALVVLLTHMLKWDQQPERRTRIWDNTISVQRQHYSHVLADNPGLKPKRAQALARAYSLARLEASTETNLPRSTFPGTCPYGWDDILQRPFEFDGAVR